MVRKIAYVLRSKDPSSFDQYELVLPVCLQGGRELAAGAIPSPCCRVTLTSVDNALAAEREMPRSLQRRYPLGAMPVAGRRRSTLELPRLHWRVTIQVSLHPHWPLADNKFVRECGSLLAGNAEQD